MDEKLKEMPERIFVTKIGEGRRAIMPSYKNPEDSPGDTTEYIRADLVTLKPVEEKPLPCRCGNQVQLVHPAKDGFHGIICSCGISMSYAHRSTTHHLIRDWNKVMGEGVK